MNAELFYIRDLQEIMQKNNVVLRNNITDILCRSLGIEQLDFFIN